MLHLSCAQSSWRLSCLSQQAQRALEVLVPEFHLCPLTPYYCQVIHVSQGNLCGLLKDHASIGNVAVTLVKLGKCHPQRMWLANCLQRKW